MPRYSARTGRWHGKRSNVTQPEGVRDERVWRTEMPGGLTRIEYGAPIPRHPSETQPIPVAGAPAEPAEPLSETPALVLPSTPQATRKVTRRDHRAITREP